MIRPNRSHPLNRGRLAWWLALPAGTGIGESLADIWGGNPASSPDPPTPVRGLGLAGMAARYDGSTQWARAAMPAVAAFTAVAWVRFDNFAGATILKNWGASVAGYLHWDASTAAPGQVRAYVNSTSGGGGNATDGGTLSAGVAYRLAVTAGGGEITLYRDGASAGTGSYSGSLDSTLPYLAFGCKLADDGSAPTADPLTAGTMGDVSLWNRALSAAEIARLDREMVAGYPNLLTRDRPNLARLRRSGGPKGAHHFYRLLAGAQSS